MESQHPLRIKWFHISFHRLVFLHSNGAAAGLWLLLTLGRNKEQWVEAAVGEGTSFLQTGNISHCMAFMKEMYVQKPLMCITCYYQCQSILFLISTWLLCMFSCFFLHFYLFSPKEIQHLFNKSEKGCKQNALCCSNRDWRAFQRPSRDINAMWNSVSLTHTHAAIWLS